MCKVIEFMCFVCGKSPCPTPICKNCINKLKRHFVSQAQADFFKEDKMNIEVHLKALQFRLKLCDRVLSSTNMILAYTKLEEIFVWYYQNSKLLETPEEKSLERFDKLKNLALGNKNLNERKLAFDRSIQLMDKIMNGDILK